MSFVGAVKRVKIKKKVVRCNTYGEDETNLDSTKNDAEVSRETNDEIELVESPKMNGCFVVDKAEHGSDYNRRQNY